MEATDEKGTAMTAPDYPTGHELLAGKTVLVTAAAGTGIGFATAKRCVEEGARVVISDIHERRLRESADELGVHGVVANVTDEADVQRLVAEAIAVGDGRLDVLVNNAGLGGTARLTEMTDEQWFAVLDVTLTGTMRMTPRRAAAHERAGRGRDRQQRVSRGLARPGRPVALRGGQGGRHGTHAVRGG